MSNPRKARMQVRARLGTRWPAYASSVVPPATRPSTSATRMIAPYTASIQNAGISASVSTFCRMPSSKTAGQRTEQTRPCRRSG